ncbi:glutamine-rich protein 2-like [Myxocyprinus asiaticus]|uniref:glutamine-rich protein 2-like n=1 Tax=Myxocyprinus asiaticus TaxID=70543 RepID=UPI0022222973|nr:glutamine-rich protein 2-like [Myxocyprinus asiaticus]
MTAEKGYLNSLRLVIEDMMTSSSPFSKRQQQEPVMFSKDKGHVQGLDLAQGLIQGSFQFQGVGQAQGHVQGWVQGQGHIQGSVQDQGHVQGLGQDQGHVQGLGQVQSMCQTQGQSSGHVLSQSSDHVLDQSLDQSQCSGQDRGQDQHTDLQDQGQHQTEGQDLEQEISQLFQCFDKPESMITPLMDQEHDRCKNAELVTDVQGAILQLQAELKKLHSISSHLIEEHSKKQIHIDHLYKTMEELDEKKANKELVEMEIENKADKHALESKVSCMQFDSVTEQLNSMLQELLSKISGQEQDWNKIMEKISTEMDCKLNRIELDPLKKQLDDRWRSIHKQLQTPPAPEQDDAAGLRKQLLAPFHCISCDRPVDMTPGQHLVTLPSAPGLPTHKSNRPYTVYELEQVRQHCRSLTPGSNQDNFRMACVKRGMRQDQRSYTLMHRQIEQENSHFPTSKAPEHPYSQTLPELAWPRPRPTMSPLKKSSRKPSKHERIPEMADYSYLARSCGGSHTLTYPHRRYTRLQHITHLIQSEEESQPVSSGPPIQAEVVDILGMDGQVYKGRMSSRAVRTTESRLPTISPREGNCKSKDKVNCLPSQRSSGVDAGRGSPARPQSAKTQRSHSASSSSVRERPTSSMDNLSQGITLQSSFHDTTTEPKQGLEFNKDLSQSEDEPVTSL